MHKLLSHLTNFTLNKMSDKFVNSPSLDQESQVDSSKRTMTSVFEQLRTEQKIDTQAIFDRMEHTLGKLMAGIQPFALLREQSIYDRSQAKGDCYQIIGVDVFLDKHLKPWILEVNDTPSLNISINKEGPKSLLKQECEVDKHIKTTILYNAFKLLLKTRKPKDRQERLAKRAQFADYECWHQLPTQHYMGLTRGFLRAVELF